MTSERSPHGLLSRGELVALVLLVLGVRLFALHCFPFYDDAFITYRYAANLASGLGMVFNPGAPWEPVLGTTTPFYAALLAGLAKLGLEPTRASILVNISCDVVSAVLLAQLLGRRRLAAGVALLAFASLPSLVRISVGGMEPPLFVALALGAVVAARAERLSLAGTLAAVACCVRPEAVLLVAVLALLHVRSLRQGVRLLLPVAIIGSVAAGLLASVYGNPIPQSVRAKAGNHGLGLRLARIAMVLEESFAPLGWTLAALPLVMIGYLRALRTQPAARAFALFALAMVGAYVAAGAKTWGWYYYAPLCAWCMTLGLGTEAALGSVRGLGAALDRAPMTWAATTLLAVAGFVATRQFPDQVTPKVYEPLAAWTREVGLAEQGARVEASDIGAIGYFSGALVLDSEGLVWPQARKYGGQLALIEAERPEYVLMVAERGRLLPFSESDVFAEYVAVARFNVDGNDDLEPDPASVPVHWTQDYIIYARRADASTGG